MLAGAIPNPGQAKRLMIEFKGVRPEDARLYAVYLAGGEP